MDYKLQDEDALIAAENTLALWATILADAGRDMDAAEAIRTQNVLLKFRLGFFDSEKSA